MPRLRLLVALTFVSMPIAACSAIWGFDDLTAGLPDENEAGDGTVDTSSATDGGLDAADVVRIFDSARQEAAVCNPLGQGCSGSAACCTANCVPTDAAGPGSCGSPIHPCSAPGTTCTKNDECCTFSCVGGKCADVQCVPDKPTPGACTSDFDCCSQNCVDDGKGGGICAPIPVDMACRTLGSPCANGSECCSKQCANGLCNNASFCQQETDVCSANFQCCSGNCVIAGGQILGRCGAPPAVGASSCVTNGTICPTDGGCTTCCSRHCGALGAGPITVCQPNGCEVTGSLCSADNQCCGHAGSPPPVNQPVACAKVSAGDAFGRCDNGGACREPGSTCKPTGASCTAENDCCEPPDASGSSFCNGSPDSCCKRDAIGVPRCRLDFHDCTTTPTPPATKDCVTSADCCDNPCIGTKCVAALCVPSGGTCLTSSDCCFGVTCARGPNAPSGICGGTVLPDGGAMQGGLPPASCGLLGQACPSDAGVGCCSGVPCTNGRCRSPNF